MSVVILMISFGLFGQDYYITRQGDSVTCEIKRVFPDGIKVKTDKKEDHSLEATQIKAFTKDGIYFVSKQITNREKKPFIFLPYNAGDTRYNYDKKFKLGEWDWIKTELIVTSGTGIRFYELIESGTPKKNYLPRVEYTFYIESDSLGMRMIPYLSAIGGNADKIDVINALYDYLRDNESIEKKLSLNESWKTFNYKGVKKLIEEYIGKKLVD